MSPVKKLMMVIAAVTLAGCTSKGGGTASPAPGGAETGSVTENAVGSTEVGQGEKYWAVYLATGRENTDRIKAAEDTVDRLGIDSVAGPVDCDYGAPEKLDMAPRDLTVGVYFVNKEDADAFAASLDTPPVAIVRVQTYCAD